MDRDREPGNTSKQLNAARCRCRAGERSAAVPCPAPYANRFAAEVASWRRPRTGACDALLLPVSKCGPAVPRPSPPACPCRFASEAARPPLPCLAFGCPHECSASQRRPGAEAAAPQGRSASSVCAASSCPTRFAAESERRVSSHTGANVAPPRSASVCRFAAETARPPPSRATARDTRPSSASGCGAAQPCSSSEGCFAAESARPPPAHATACDTRPSSASDWYFSGKSANPPLSDASAGAALPCAASERSFAAESERWTSSRTGAGVAPPRSASVCRFGAEGRGAPSRTAAPFTPATFRWDHQV